ncbi:hypothetical protein JCM10908_000931 [Rhodotorula pacifica]|uniref:uncharacterized protein n=1 Tax=Rhodotorula pacifica TaxID=1495444 RepID=UPI00317FFEA1
MFDRDTDLDNAVPLPLPTQRSRRLSLPSTLPSTLRRRSRLPVASSSSADSEEGQGHQRLPPIPFASPPYMPTYGDSSSCSSLVATTSKNTSDVRRSMPISLLTTAPATPSSSRVHTPVRPRHGRTDSMRFRQRLARWTMSSSRDHLDFGCAGVNDWIEGPQDMGDAYYSQYPGTSKRGSTSSVETPTGVWTHARGESSSSTLSTVSTAASSLPSSPILRSPAKLRPSPPLEYASATSTVSSTRSVQRKIEEEAALDAVNDHFRRVRLGQLEQRRLQALDRFTFPQQPAVVHESFSVSPVASSGKVSHQRTPSDELEIEFLESGHSTFTPLEASHGDHDGESIYISYDDLSDTSTFSPADVTPVPRTTFDAIPEADETASTLSSARPSLTEASVLAPGIEEDLVPALEELSDYFASTLSSDASSSASSSAAATPVVWVPAPILPLSPTRRKAAVVSVPDLSTFAFPPREAKPVDLSHHRGSSTASLPCMRAPPRSPTLPSRHKRGESASFAAAQRTRLVAAGRVKPTATERHLLKERNTLYDWI